MTYECKCDSIGVCASCKQLNDSDLFTYFVISYRWQDHTMFEFCEHIDHCGDIIERLKKNGCSHFLVNSLGCLVVRGA